MDFNGIRRLYLPLRPKVRFSPGRKTPPSVSAPSSGLRPLSVSRVKCGGRTLSRPLSASVSTGSSPFKVRDNQRPERTMSGVENLRLSVPSPVKNCPGEVGGINCGGDMGVRRCLARSLTSLALLRTPKSANGPRSNSFRPDSPSTTNFPRGRKTQPAPSPHRTWSVPDASSNLS